MYSLQSIKYDEDKNANNDDLHSRSSAGDGASGGEIKEDDLKSMKELYSQVSSAYAYTASVLALLGLIGNLVSLLVFMRAKQKTPKIAVRKYLILLTLSNSVFLILTWYIHAAPLLYILMTSNEQSQSPKYVFIRDLIESIHHNKYTCKIVNYTLGVSKTLTILLILSFSIERAFVICFPLKAIEYKEKISPKILTLLLVILSLILNGQLIYFYELVDESLIKNQFKLIDITGLKKQCAINEYPKFHPILVLVIVITMGLPFLIVILSNIVIFIKLKQSSTALATDQTVVKNNILNLPQTIIRSRNNFNKNSMKKNFYRSHSHRHMSMIEGASSEQFLTASNSNNREQREFFSMSERRQEQQQQQQQQQQRMHSRTSQFSLSSPTPSQKSSTSFTTSISSSPRPSTSTNVNSIAKKFSINNASATAVSAASAAETSSIFSFNNGSLPLPSSSSAAIKPITLNRSSTISMTKKYNTKMLILLTTLFVLLNFPYFVVSCIVLGNSYQTDDSSVSALRLTSTSPTAAATAVTTRVNNDLFNDVVVDFSKNLHVQVFDTTQTTKEPRPPHHEEEYYARLYLICVSVSELLYLSHYSIFMACSLASSRIFRLHLRSIINKLLSLSKK